MKVTLKSEQILDQSNPEKLEILVSMQNTAELDKFKDTPIIAKIYEGINNKLSENSVQEEYYVKNTNVQTILNGKVNLEEKIVVTNQNGRLKADLFRHNLHIFADKVKNSNNNGEIVIPETRVDSYENMEDVSTIVSLFYFLTANEELNVDAQVNEAIEIFNNDQNIFLKTLHARLMSVAASNNIKFESSNLIRDLVNLEIPLYRDLLNKELDLHRVFKTVLQSNGAVFNNTVNRNDILTKDLLSSTSFKELSKKVFGADSGKFLKLLGENFYNEEKKDLNLPFFIAAKTLTEAYDKDLSFNVLSSDKQTVNKIVKLILSPELSSERSDTDKTDEAKIPGLYIQFLKELGSKRLVNIVSEIEVNKTETEYFSDTLKQYVVYCQNGLKYDRIAKKNITPIEVPDNLSNKDARSEVEHSKIKDMHDKISDTFASIELAMDDEPLDTELLKKHRLLYKLEGVDFKGLTIQVPKSKAYLANWGRMMGNCVGSYWSAVSTDRVFICSLNDPNTGKMLYNIELHFTTTAGKGVEYKINQIKGVRNSNVDDEKRNIFEKFVNDKYKEYAKEEKEKEGNVIDKLMNAIKN